MTMRMILGVMLGMVLGVFAVLEEGEQLVALNSFSLQPPYIEENLQNRWWNFGGDAVMDVNKYVRLTQDRQSKAGWLWGKVPFTSASWIIEFEFSVHGAGTSLFGDGFAFWLTSDREVGGPVFGSKDHFNGLGIFFDTYANGKHRFAFPYVTAMLGDGRTAYDVGSDGKTTEFAGCSSEFRNKEYATKARLKYVKGAVLQLDLDVKGNQIYETCFSATNVTLPSFGYLGFSAHTGDATDNHDIISVTTNGIVNPNAARYTQNNQNQYGSAAGKSTTSSSSSWSSIGTAVVILIGIVVLMAVGAGVFVVMQKMKEKSYKRF